MTQIAFCLRMAPIQRSERLKLVHTTFVKKETSPGHHGVLKKARQSTSLTTWFSGNLISSTELMT